MKAVKTTQIVMSVREYRFLRDCAMQCADLRKDHKKEMALLSQIPEEERTDENVNRFNYIKDILTPTNKYFKDLFNGDIWKPKMFELGELKHRLICLVIIFNKKIVAWNEQIEELGKQRDNVSVPYDDFITQHIVYAENEIKQIENTLNRLSNMFVVDDDVTLLEDFNESNEYMQYEEIMSSGQNLLK
jgi:hypothetical protein